MTRRWTYRLLRRRALLLFAALFAIGAAASHAQMFDASHLRGPAELGASWRIEAGDDPAFARPDFDDSRWRLFDPRTSVAEVFPQHPEIIWYRLHVKVDPAARDLALNEWNISHAFEVYVNGERLITVGRIRPPTAATTAARVLARIPDRMLATGNLVIALRVRDTKSDWTNSFPGYYVANLVIGPWSSLYQQNWLSVLGENASKWADQLLVVGVGLVALVLYAAQRQRSEYLWIAALGAQQLLEAIVPLIATFHSIPVIWDQLTILLRVATPYLWVSLYFAFVHQRMNRAWKIALVAVGALTALSGFGLYTPLPLVLQFLTSMPFIVLLAVVVPFFLCMHWLRGNREAGILLIPAVLFSLYIYGEVGFEILYEFPRWREQALRGLNLIDRFPAGPFAISLDHVASILSSLALAFIMLARSSKMSRRQAQLEHELAAAQQLQQLLLPEKSEVVPGYRVETVYQPAQEVGGDFFQILSDGDGGMLVVVGDVAGKGLPAAMLVSVLVGAIRGIAEFTLEPADLLGSLNDRLVGRAGGGFSTALVARISPEGRVRTANAGHLSPYLNGLEIELPGALPLGVAASVEYATTEFRMAPGDRLTFYSDGVVEAQGAKGELFGFERAREISTQPAAHIVEAAISFGQQDDITVVAVERGAAVASAA